MELENTIHSLENSQIRRKPESNRITRENTSQTYINDSNFSITKHLDPVPQNKESLRHACGSEKHEIKDCESKRNFYIIDLERNQIIDHKLRKELEKYGEVKSMRARQDKYGRKGNIGLAFLETKEQEKLAIKMLKKTKQYVANEYKHKKQTNNLNNNTKEKDKRYKKQVEENQHQETKTCHACVSKKYLRKKFKKNTNLLVTNEQWRDISEEELKYYLKEYGKVKSIKTRRNRYLGMNEALVWYRTAEDGKTALADINMY